MVFNSIFFICFFLPLVIIVYYCIKESLRNLFLVSVSLFFLAWGSVDCLKIIVLIILADFLITRGYSRTPKVKKALLLAGIILNIGILCYFKYLQEQKPCQTIVSHHCHQIIDRRDQASDLIHRLGYPDHNGNLFFFAFNTTHLAFVL